MSFRGAYDITLANSQVAGAIVSTTGTPFTRTTFNVSSGATTVTKTADSRYSNVVLAGRTRRYGTASPESVTVIVTLTKSSTDGSSFPWLPFASVTFTANSMNTMIPVRSADWIKFGSTLESRGFRHAGSHQISQTHLVRAIEEKVGEVMTWDPIRAFHKIEGITIVSTRQHRAEVLGPGLRPQLVRRRVLFRNGCDNCRHPAIGPRRFRLLPFCKHTTTTRPGPGRITGIDSRENSGLR